MTTSLQPHQLVTEITGENLGLLYPAITLLLCVCQQSQRKTGLYKDTVCLLVKNKPKPNQHQQTEIQKEKHGIQFSVVRKIFTVFFFFVSQQLI
jgi:hypothetical protein